MLHKYRPKGEIFPKIDFFLNDEGLIRALYFGVAIVEFQIFVIYKNIVSGENYFNKDVSTFLKAINRPIWQYWPSIVPTWQRFGDMCDNVTNIVHN